MNRVTLLALLPLVFALALWGCDNSTDNEIGGPGGGEPPIVTELSCQGCHTDRAMLEASLGEVSGSKAVITLKGDG